MERLPNELLCCIYEFDSYKYDMWNKCNCEINEYIKRRNSIMFQYVHTHLPINFAEYEFHEWLLQQTQQVIIYDALIVIKKYKILSKS